MIGRRVELATILAELNSAGLDRCAVTALVRGPGGIGKSTVVNEILRQARASGAVTLLGRADDFDRGVPFGVFRDAFSRLRIQDLPPEAHDAFHEVRAALDVRALIAGDGPDSGRHRRRDRILLGLAGLLPILARDAPTVLALEDMHAADPDSLSLAALLGRNIADGPLLILMSSRTGYDEQLGEMQRYVERLAGDGRACVVDLGPLPDAAISEMLADEMGSAPSAELVEMAVRDSGGNPFFAKELAGRLLGNSSKIKPDVPKLVGRFFSGRDREFDTASVLSLFGRFGRSHLSLLRELTHQSDELTVEILGRLIAKQLLIGTENGYEFSHLILKDLLYAELGDARRRSMHRQIAEILARRRKAGHDVDDFELATHAYAAGLVGDALTYESCLQAADLATDRAPLVAAQWYGRTLEMMPRTDVRRPEIHASLVYDLIIAAETTQAIAASRRAIAEFPATQSHPSLTFAAANAMFAGNCLAEALAVIERELATGTELPSLLNMRLALLGQMGHPDAESAYQQAKNLTVPESPLETAAAASMLMSYAILTGRTSDYGEFEARMRASLPAVPRPIRSEMLHLLATMGLQGVGGIAVAHRDLQAGRDLVGPRPLTSAGGTAELSELLLGYYQGRWDEALRRIEVIVPALEVCGSTTVLYGVRAIATILLTDREEFDRASEIGRGLLPGTAGTRSMVAVARSRLAWTAGRHEEAVKILAERAEEAARLGQVSQYTLVTEEWALLLHQSGRFEAAAEVAVEAAAHIDRWGWPLLDLYADRTLAAVTGDRAAGLRAAATAEAEGAPFELARCRLVLGELDVDPAVNLRTAFGTFRAVGAVGLARRTATALRAGGFPVPRTGRADADAGRLTPLEISLARLVVEGLSNRQIATAMHYSAKTVEAYLSRIYAKTGFGSRVELTRAAYSGVLDLKERHAL